MIKNTHTDNRSQKILWVIPGTGNYRVPVYSYLNQYTNGNFHLICLKEDTSDLVREKLKKSLKENLTILTGEKRLTIGNDKTTFANSCMILKWQPGLYRAIKKQNPDIVIVEGFGSWAPKAVLYSFLHRKKLCIFYERTAYIERKTPWYLTLYRKFINCFANAYLVNGRLTEEYLTEKIGVKRKPITKGCMCADSYQLAKDASSFSSDHQKKLKDGLHLNSGLTFLFVGRLVEIKGILQLLQAWQKHIAKYTEDNLVFIGNGYLRDEITTTYGQTRGVHILGGISYDEIYKYYTLCDIFFMPTLEDNWCLVLPEAMACGKPVACSIYNGGTCELIKDGVNGYSFDPYQQKSILDALSSFHTADLTSMGQKSIEIESHFSPDKATRRIYNTCIDICKY